MKLNNKRILVLLLILLILILIILINIINKSTFSYDAEYNYIHDNLFKEKWSNYRIGDVLTYSTNKEYLNKYGDFSYHHNYKDSIASDYLKENKQNTPNYNLLNRLIKERVTDKNTYDDTLFLHIRIGDVICKFGKNNEYQEHYSKVNNNNWWLREVIEYIKKNNISKVIIVSGSHLNECIKESTEYLLDRKRFLIELIPNLKVEIRIPETPDQTLAMFYNVKHYISTGGRFGNLITELNRLKKH